MSLSKLPTVDEPKLCTERKLVPLSNSNVPDTQQVVTAPPVCCDLVLVYKCAACHFTFYFTLSTSLLEQLVVGIVCSAKLHCLCLCLCDCACAWHCPVCIVWDLNIIFQPAFTYCHPKQRCQSGRRQGHSLTPSPNRYL